MKHALLIVSLFMSTHLFSQNLVDFSNQKKIKIMGNSEIELEATSYIVDIVIKETYHQPTQANQSGYIDSPIDSIDKTLKESLAELGIDKKYLKLEFVGSVPNSSYNATESRLIYENFELTLKNFSDLLNVAKNLKFDGLSGFRIRRLFDEDDITVQTQLYTLALNNAKLKAEKILSSANKSVGEILFIDGTNNYNLPVVNDGPRDNYYGNYAEFDFKRKKKIETSLYVTFEIK